MGGNIIITGASSGIGQATAERFLAEGWNVGLLARREDRLRDLAASSDRAQVLVADVTNEAEVAAAFVRFQKRFARLDVLFNNAGVFTQGGVIDEVGLDDWRKSVDVNLTGAFICAQAAFGMMRRQTPQGGRIINNGSISAQSPRANSAPYTATKHAISGLTKSISLDGRAFDIAAGQIDIGNAATEMVSALAERAKAGDAEPVMDVVHVAQAVFQMAKLPLDTNILSMTIMATKMAFVGRG
ncbi:MAG: SDR family oxidoreductase [Rhodobacteraceae bacterium]|nr:SDR family oxidoreductase [Paracoccaceae bacterium]